jgi:2-amino-4-hydroxy-6-hydroxymethyldihydropteridine diphosphokinase
MPRVWVSLGSNIDRERCIRGAVAALRGRFGELTVSRVFESEAVDFQGQPFYNLVVGFHTQESPAALRVLFRGIEETFGRERGPNRFAPRTLDIDLLTYGDRVMREDGIELPRGEIARYAFVLRPLAEVAGDEIHPQAGRSYRAMWEGFDRSSQPLRPLELDLG